MIINGILTLFEHSSQMFLSLVEPFCDRLPNTLYTHQVTSYKIKERLDEILRIGVCTTMQI